MYHHDDYNNDDEDDERLSNVGTFPLMIIMGRRNTLLRKNENDFS